MLINLTIEVNSAELKIIADALCRKIRDHKLSYRNKKMSAETLKWEVIQATAAEKILKKIEYFERLSPYEIIDCQHEFKTISTEFAGEYGQCIHCGVKA